MRTLYLTDLDGTLLGRGARLSAFSRAGLERLYDAGVAVTAATARSWSALDVLQGVRFRAPMILLGGGFTMPKGEKFSLSKPCRSKAPLRRCTAFGTRGCRR